MANDAEFQKQYAALTEGAGVAPLAGRTIIALRGSDRVTLLHSFCTNDIKRLHPGTGCEAFITNPQGKTLGHVLVFCEADQLVLETTPGQAAALISHLDKYVITEDVQFVDRTRELLYVLVAGSGAAELLHTVSGHYPPTALLGHSPATIAERPVVIRRIEYAGPASYLVQSAMADSEAVTAALLSAGGVHCDGPALESARLEAGVPLFDIDITPDNLPQEIGRDARAISFTKGCYLGQETVARIDALGHVNRVLVGLKFAGTEIPPPETPLSVGGRTVGHVTSAAWSPKLNAPLALGLVRRSSLAKDAGVTSAIGDVQVVSLPLVAGP